MTTGQGIRRPRLGLAGLVGLGGLSGVLSPLASLGLIMAAVARSPRFNWHYDALSDLGVGPTAALFNSALIGGGALNVIAAVGLLAWLGPDWLTRTGTALLVLGAVAVGLTGVITTDYGALHNAIAATYFLLTPLGCLAVAAAFAVRRLWLHGALTGSAGAAALVAALLTPHQGIAVPEMLAVLILSAWAYAMGMMLLIQPRLADGASGG